LLLKRIALFLVSLALCLADVRPDPKPKPAPAPASATKVTSVLTVTSSETELTILRIPKTVLDQLRAENVPVVPSADSKTRNVLAAIFLSLAIIAAGFWFSQRHGLHPAARHGVSAGVALLLIASATSIWADIRPQHRPPVVNRGTLTDIRCALSPSPKILSGPVSVEIIPEGSVIQLIIPESKSQGGPNHN
jgi:hypothetical protein